MLAQADSTVPGLDLLGGTTLGIVLLLLLLGWLWAKPAVDNLKNENARILSEKLRVEEQRDALIGVYQDQVIPVLKDVNAQVLPELKTLSAAVAALASEVKELRGR